MTFTETLSPGFGVDLDRGALPLEGYDVTSSANTALAQATYAQVGGAEQVDVVYAYSAP